MSLRLSRLCRLIVCIILVVSLFCFSCVPSYALGEAITTDAMLNLAGIFLAMQNMGFTFSGIDISSTDAYQEIYDSLTPQLQDWLNVARFKLSPVSGYLSIAGKAWPKVKEIAQYWKDQLSSSDDTLHWLTPSSGSWGEFSSGSFSYSGARDSSIYTYQVPSGVYYRLCEFSLKSGASAGNTILFIADHDFVISEYKDGAFLNSYSSSTGHVTSGGVTYSYLNLDGWRISASFTRIYQQVQNYVSSFLNSDPEVLPPVDASLSVDGSDAIIPEGQIDDNKDVYVGSSDLDLGTVPDAISNIFDHLFHDSAVPPDVNISQDINDLTNVNLDILSNVRNASSFLEVIAEGVGSLVLDLVGFLGELPTFIGNLSGKFLSIWHYVIDWVNSMRPFLGSMFSVWQGLPYAMVVPVYASIVIVVVLGMYKKFFM